MRVHGKRKIQKQCARNNIRSTKSRITHYNHVYGLQSNIRYGRDKSECRRSTINKQK